jgi:hypothetical protein
MIDIKRLRELTEKATTGPWEAHWVKQHTGGECCFIEHGNAEMPSLELDIATHADADFIAAARNSLPELLDELERLRARVNNLVQIKRAKEALEAELWQKQ